MSYGLPNAELLPWGYVVWVKEVDPDSPYLEGQNGTWDVDSRTIYIDKSLSLPERRYVFAHEYRTHAIGDWELWANQSCPMKAPQAEEREESGDDGDVGR